MAKNKGIYKLFRSKEAFDSFKKDVIHFSRIYTLDDVTIALGRMGFTEEQFREFGETYAAVAHEYAEETMIDSESDKDMWYSHECKDREIKQYVGSLFAPWDERFG